MNKSIVSWAWTSPSHVYNTNLIKEVDSCTGFGVSSFHFSSSLLWPKPNFNMLYDGYPATANPKKRLHLEKMQHTTLLSRRSATSLLTSFYRSNPKLKIRAIINKELECRKEKNKHPSHCVICTQLCSLEARTGADVTLALCYH